MNCYITSLESEMDMNDLTNAALEDLPRLLIIFGIGILGFVALKYFVEPWVIETACRELVKCD